MKVRITEIHPKDAWYDKRSVFVGLTGFLFNEDDRGFDFSFDDESLGYIKAREIKFSLDDFHEIFGDGRIGFYSAEYEEI